LAEEIQRKVIQAKEASRKLARASSLQKNEALTGMARALIQGEAAILQANHQDLEAAKGAGHSAAFLDRLTLNSRRIHAMARALEEIAALPDPVGEVAEMTTRPNGLMVGRMRVPLGVVGIIYESRPSVTADAAGLCLKAGNAVILRGGKEALSTNIAIVDILARELIRVDLPEGTIILIETPDRAAMLELLQLDQMIDLLIPRGGPELIRFVVENSRIPVIRHEKGLSPSKRMPAAIINFPRGGCVHS